MYSPAVEEDTIGYLDSQQFYPYLYQYRQKFIRKHPKKKEEVTRLLKEIKESSEFKKLQHDAINKDRDIF